MSSVSTNITSNEEYVKRNKTVQQSAHFSSVFFILSYKKCPNISLFFNKKVNVNKLALLSHVCIVVGVN